MDDAVRLGTWPELLYRFIEHYKWEPQHLTAADYDARMRRQEVPLNFMLNLLLRCSTSDAIRFLFQIFQPIHPDLNDNFELMFPWETKATQPDVRLEGEQSRVFIEVKVDAGITLEQVNKYAQLHRDMDEKFGAKRHYLLFLTRRPFEKCWRPRSEIAQFGDVHSFIDEKLATQVGSAHPSVKCSAATWGSFSRQLEALYSSMDAVRIVERRIVNDFLSDLLHRGLQAEISQGLTPI